MKRRDTLVQLNRPLIVRDAVSQIELKILSRGQVVPCICVLRLKLRRMLEKGTRQRDILQLQLRNALLQGDSGRVAASSLRVSVVLQGIFRETPRPKNVGGHLEIRSRCARRVRQVRRYRDPLYIAVAQGSVQLRILRSTLSTREIAATEAENQSKSCGKGDETR